MIKDNKQKESFMRLCQHTQIEKEKNSMFFPQINIVGGRNQAVTLKKLCEMWLQFRRIHIKRSTAIKYEDIIEKHINPSLGDYLVCDLDTDILLSYIHNKLSVGRLNGEGGLSATYVRMIAIVLNSVLEFGTQEHLCQNIKIRRAIPSAVKYQPKTLSQFEQKRLEIYLLNHVNPTSIGILLALRAGLRIGEVCALNTDDIDFNDKVISVRSTAVRVKDADNHTTYLLDIPKTKTSVRDIPIVDFLYQVLHKFACEKSPIYFASGTDSFITPPTFEYRYHRMMEAAGIPNMNFHALRHTFATRCIESGMDDKSLSEILGHSNVSITLNTYVHSSMKLKRAHMERVSAMMAV